MCAGVMAVGWPRRLDRRRIIWGPTADGLEPDGPSRGGGCYRRIESVRFESAGGAEQRSSLGAAHVRRGGSAEPQYFTAHVARIIVVVIVVNT